MPVAKTAEVSQTSIEIKPEELKGIRPKLLYIQRHIEVEKLGYHSKNDAKYYTDEDIVLEVAKYLNLLGILTTIRDRRGNHSAQFDPNGRYKPTAFIEATFVFHDVETGEEWPIEVSGEGTSTGGQDATRISHTMIHKIAYIETFKIREENGLLDTDDERTTIEDATPPEKKSETSKADAETLAALVKKVNALKDGGIDGKIVVAEGSLISDRILGEGKKMAEWKKDARVMEALVTKLESIATTGEVS